MKSFGFIGNDVFILVLVAYITMTTSASTDIMNIEDSVADTSIPLKNISQFNIDELQTDEQRQKFVDDLRSKGYSEDTIVEILIKGILAYSNSSVPPNNEPNELEKAQQMIDEINEEYEKVEILDVDPSVKKVSYLWVILVATEPHKDNFIADIKNASIEEKQKDELITSLQKIWRDYPVERTKDGHLTHITFANEEDVVLSYDEQKVLEEVFLIRKKAYAPLDRGNVLKWGGEAHNKMTYYAVFYNTDTTNAFHDYANTAADSSLAPDYWTYIPEVYRYLDHGYDPIIGYGGAHLRVEQYTPIAISNYSSGNFYAASQLLGYSSHFLTDVGNPLHTG